MPDENRRLNENDAKKVKDLSVFDENDPEQHVMKLLFGLGCVIGCRGGEYTNFEVSQLSKGEFPSDHEWRGHSWFSINGMTDKSHKLSVHKDHVRNTKRLLRFPVVGDGNANDVGGSIMRYLDKIGVAQLRFFCHPLTDQQKKRHIERGGLEEVEYDGSRPMSVSHINRLFKKGASMLGLEVSRLKNKNYSREN